MIASLSIPWGEIKGDEQLGGYHLVWTRDLVNSVTGLMAAGDNTTAMRALIYLACSQQLDGGFPQNFWIDGDRVLDRRAARRDFVSDHARVAAASARRAGQLRSVSDGEGSRAVPDDEGPGHAAGSMGRKFRLLAVDAGGQYRGDDLRGRACARSRRAGLGAQYLEEYADFLECHLENGR